MENYNNPDSTYNQNIWSENPEGYFSGYDRGMSGEDSSSEKYKDQGKEEMPKKENGLGKIVSEIYDSQNHPFCFGTGMSSSF